MGSCWRRTTDDEGADAVLSSDAELALRSAWPLGPWEAVCAALTVAARATLGSGDAGRSREALGAAGVTVFHCVPSKYRSARLAITRLAARRG